MNDAGKQAAAYAAVDACVKPGMSLGLGTGTTAYWMIERIGERVAEGWALSVVATSEETERLCKERRIPLVGLLEGPPLAFVFDGADEVAPDFSLIKGGGGALFRERAVALVASSLVIAVTENKLVKRLGAFPLPVESVPFAVRYVMREIASLGASAMLRKKNDAPFITDNGNYVLDCLFQEAYDPAELDRSLRAIHGVVTTGLFVGLAKRIFVGSPDGSAREL